MKPFVRLARDFFYDMGVDIQRAKFTLAAARKRLFDTNRVDLVLDVGANRGQYTQLLRESGYTGQIISFEPIPKVYEKLTTAFGNDPKWRGRNYALGASTHRASFNVSENTVSSSLLNVTADTVTTLNATRIVETIDVEVLSLQEAVGEILPQYRVHLKLDTQGSELSVIEGSGASLSHIDSIECELSLVEVYRGQPLMFTVMERLYGEGYRAISMTNGFRNQLEEVLQVDALFTR